MFLSLKILQSLRLLIAPLVRCCWRKRLSFEAQNGPILASERRRCALFEVSSQGEWEQVRPLVLALLASEVPVDILYASSSVEKEMELAAQNLKGLRVRRLELIKEGTRAQILKWSDPALVFFCRYDFYPELLLLGERAPLVLLNASLKNKNSWWQKSLMRLVLNHFHTVVWSSALDFDRGAELDLKADLSQLVGDLRPLAILERQKEARQTMDLRSLPRLRKYWEQSLGAGDLLVGSAWPSDVSFLLGEEKFKTLLRAGKIKLWLAPHQLGEERLKELEKLVQEFLGTDIPHYFLKDDQFDSDLLGEARIVFNTIPRLLCESYVFFPKVMVGGGFERSVHSISEPFYAGAVVGVGPKTHRSTEYEEAIGLDSKRLFRFASAPEWELFLSSPLPKDPWPCQDREKELLELRNHLCSLAMSMLPL